MRHLPHPSTGDNDLRRMLLPQGKPQPVARHETVCRRGQSTELVWLVQHGWAAARGIRQGSRSPILRLYLPGDAIGLTELGLDVLPNDVTMLTEGLLHAVPRSALAATARQNPRLWALLLGVANTELALANTRAVLFDRAVAEERLIHFLLDLRGRLAVEGVGDGNRFPLPMNQQEIGEATGMTGIYVNRLMGRLVRDGRIEVQRPYLRLVDRPYLESRIDFLDAVPTIDLSWAGRA